MFVEAIYFFNQNRCHVQLASAKEDEWSVDAHRFALVGAEHEKYGVHFERVTYGVH